MKAITCNKFLPPSLRTKLACFADSGFFLKHRLWFEHCYFLEKLKELSKISKFEVYFSFIVSTSSFSASQSLPFRISYCNVFHLTFLFFHSFLDKLYVFATPLLGFSLAHFITSFLNSIVYPFLFLLCKILHQNSFCLPLTNLALTPYYLY